MNVVNIPKLKYFQKFSNKLPLAARWTTLIVSFSNCYPSFNLNTIEQRIMTFIDYFLQFYFHLVKFTQNYKKNCVIHFNICYFLSFNFVIECIATIVASSIRINSTKIIIATIK